ncbi:helix-turn-helix domain-containing protein [Bradyrhizobium sp. U87765 SZCCT0131]|nr:MULTISPECIES: helix-turn-helix domain-containing protein [unclassified Bradyrhizobium]MBR1221279.1 helix-turn-helix domain-containing protein [Bradyrhizobium sp. U87765 SZCCT0131]MBR1350117.1 helix-turn-helix domain-containing protein [Bradyrhizobium sp. U87765 SZCCT0048]
MLFPETDRASSEAYRRMMLPLFEFELPEFAREAPFASEAEVYCLPEVTVSRTRSSAVRLTRTIRTIAQSATDQILVVCYTSGHFTFKTGGAERRVDKGELAFFDLSQEIVIEAPSVANISLAISRRRLEALFPLLDLAHGMVLESGALTRVLIGMMEQSMAIGPAMTLAEARPIADAIVGLVVACLENVSREQAPANAGTGTASLAAMKSTIERRLSDPSLGPQTLIDEFAITRSTLYRAFEPLGGVSAYITERRLRYALRRITDPAQPRLRISQLAFEFGFSHAPAFTRAFKAFFGMSPKDVRDLIAHPEADEVPFMVSPDALPYLRPIEPAAAEF